MNKKFASSIDVARLAGVSQSTVSRAFRNHPSVLKSTAENVMKAADSLGYRPSLLPRIMLTQQSKLVALVVGGLQNPYYASVIEMITPPPKGHGGPDIACSCGLRRRARFNGAYPIRLSG